MNKKNFTVTSGSEHYNKVKLGEKIALFFFNHVTSKS